MSKNSNKFSPDIRERAVLMVQEHRVEYPSMWATIESIAPKTGCIAFKDIATSIDHGLEVPVASLAPTSANTRFDWFSVFAAMNARTASQLTQERLSWRPNQPGLLSDVMCGHYFKL